ncbi:hypothetical protein ARSEF4850_007864 [Beauveria asiatica]
MAHYGRLDNGVPDPDGRGYLGTLDVYHELDCPKRLHQYTYPDYYFRDLTPDALHRLPSPVIHVSRDKRGEEEPVYRRSNDNAATA